MKPPSQFVDKWGLLDKHYLPDGGDSAHREGMYWALLGMIESKNGKVSEAFYRPGSFEAVMKKIMPHYSVILRHSYHGYDASDWDRMSRDQLQPNIIAAGYWSERILDDIHRGHRERAYLLTSNTRKNGATKKNHGQDVAGEVRDYSWKFPDLTGPEIWGNFIRAYKAWWLYPLLLIFDLELFFGSVKWRYFPSHNIAMNHTLSLLQAMDRMPTPWVWLARKIMPATSLIELIKDHFNDFPDDMEFFGPMFTSAWRRVKNG